MHNFKLREGWFQAPLCIHVVCCCRCGGQGLPDAGAAAGGAGDGGGGGAARLLQGRPLLRPHLLAVTLCCPDTLCICIYLSQYNHIVTMLVMVASVLFWELHWHKMDYECQNTLYCLDTAPAPAHPLWLRRWFCKCLQKVMQEIFAKVSNTKNLENLDYHLLTKSAN